MERARSLSGTGTLKVGHISGPVRYELAVTESYGLNECCGTINADPGLIEVAFSAAQAKIVRDDTGNAMSIVVKRCSSDGTADVDLSG